MTEVQRGFASAQRAGARIHPERELPETGTPANTRVPVSRRGLTLVHSAEVVGHGMGVTVAQFRKLPQQARATRTNLSLAADRTKSTAAQAAAGLVDRAVQHTSELTDAAARQAVKIRNRAELRALEFTNRAANRAAMLGNQARIKASNLRIAARQRWFRAGVDAQHGIAQARRQAQYWRREYPLETAMTIAAGAFVIGAALRVWRSKSWK